VQVQKTHDHLLRRCSTPDQPPDQAPQQHEDVRAASVYEYRKSVADWTLKLMIQAVDARVNIPAAPPILRLPPCTRDAQPGVPASLKDRQEAWYNEWKEHSRRLTQWREEVASVCRPTQAPPPPAPPDISFDWQHSTSPPVPGSASASSTARAAPRAAKQGGESDKTKVDPSDYPNHKGIPDKRMEDIMEEFIRGLRRRPDQEAYIKIEGAEWNERWRKKWETHCNIDRSCFKLVWEEEGLSNEDKNKIPPRLRSVRDTGRHGQHLSLQFFGHWSRHRGRYARSDGGHVFDDPNH
jgi:hypothetical protein